MAETFDALLSGLKSLPVYLPDLNRVLLEYPAVELTNSHSAFYWEKVNFGLKPTTRIVQQIIYRGDGPTGRNVRGGIETAIRQPLFSDCA